MYQIMKGVKMIMAKSVNPSIDRKVFSNTANKTKSVNVGVKFMRGGIRL